MRVSKTRGTSTSTDSHSGYHKITKTEEREIHAENARLMRTAAIPKIIQAGTPFVILHDASGTRKPGRNVVACPFAPFLGGRTKREREEREMYSRRICFRNW